MSAGGCDFIDVIRYVVGIARIVNTVIILLSVDLSIV
jgi:hypothetical protein